MCLQKVYGYARVSAKDQKLDRQIDALTAFPVSVTNIFSDKSSGKDFDRPNYKKLLRRLKPGDVVVVESIDRLGRSYSEILEQWRIITKEKEAAMVVLDMPLLDTRESRDNLTGVFLSDVILQLLSYIAQIERENLRQRQAEGIAAARARGVRFGRPPVKKPSNYRKVKQSFLDGAISRKSAAEMLGISVTTFNNWIKSDTVTSS